MVMLLPEALRLQDADTHIRRSVTIPGTDLMLSDGD